MQSFDVLIIGAGPAGSTAALAMADSGYKVGLLEQATFPRDKVCGDALAPYVPNVLATIDPALKKALGELGTQYQVDTLRIVAPNDKVLDLGFELEGAICKRLDFDNFLFEQAQQLPNVTPLENCKVKSIDCQKEQVVLQTSQGQLTAAIAIGCDGAQGISSKQLTETNVDRNHYSAAVRAYYQGVEGIPEGTFELHYVEDLLPGYFWIFPLPNGQANVGFGMLSSAVSERKINLRKTLPQIIEQHPTLKKRFENATLDSKIQGFGLPLGSRKVPISGHRFMLCGDAASLIDPLSGEGIGQAIISGRYAGWQAKKCLDSSNFSAAMMKQYDKLVYQKLWNMHRLHYYTQVAINNRPWVLNSIVNWANRSSLFYRLIQKLI